MLGLHLEAIDRDDAIPGARKHPTHHLHHPALFGVNATLHRFEGEPLLAEGAEGAEKGLCPGH